MSITQLTNDDFERAVSRGFWRKVLNLLTGGDNQLLPFEEIREHLPMRGQHYAGLQQVEIDQIVGSFGRYQDFDRAFLPRQRRTKDRWVSIDRAHYQQIALPPVDLYKIGEVYFVKDGNHRISVARERGQTYVDAYVTEIDTPVLLTPETRVDELAQKKAQAEFMLQTNLDQLRPQAGIVMTIPALYVHLLQHIDVHRWYLGEQRAEEVPYEQAVLSWYDNVYQPLVEIIRTQNLLHDFPASSEAELYLWIMEYQVYVMQAYKVDDAAEENIRAEAARQLTGNYPLPAVKKLVGAVSKAPWLESLILEQEKTAFYEKTRLREIRPQAQIETTLPGQYDRLREHIAVHRWYLGEQRKMEVSYDEAAASWYDAVYSPLVEIIRQQDILKEFPGRTETDLYLWIIKHQWGLRETYGGEVAMEDAAEQFVAGQTAAEASERPVEKMVKAIKKATGLE